MKKRKLIWHIYPAFLVIALAVLLAVTWCAAHSFRIFYYNQVAGNLEAKARLVEYQIKPIISSGNFPEIDNICKTLGKTVSTRITVILPDGRVIGDSDENPTRMKNHSNRPEIKEAISSDTGKSLRFSNTLGKNMMYWAFSIKQDDKVVAVVRTSVPLAIIDQELARLYKKILWTGLIITVCAAAVSWVVSKRLSRPIEQMTKAAQGFASGQLSQRLPIPDSAELAELAKVLNEMEEVRRDFVANVSHELKTPITSIKGFVETLQEGAIDKPEEAKRFLEIIAKHTDRLNLIVDDLLSLSRLEEDDEKRKLSFETALLKPVLISAVELSKIKAESKNIKIDITCDEKITAKINSTLIEQAVLNLIDNAVKYSSNSSKIKIDVKKSDGQIEIIVADTGCGIGSEHLDRIFERFYVVDKARSRKLGGTGLGLAIVKHIAQVHNGSVSVESAVNKGSAFTISLPQN
jgi:signal transduction histidine kinase